MDMQWSEGQESMQLLWPQFPPGDHHHSIDNQFTPLNATGGHQHTYCGIRAENRYPLISMALKNSTMWEFIFLYCKASFYVQALIASWFSFLSERHHDWEMDSCCHYGGSAMVSWDARRRSKFPLCPKEEISAISGSASHRFTETWRPGRGVGQLSEVMWAGLDGVPMGHKYRL